MFQKTVSMTFFIDHCDWNFFLLESQCVSSSWTVFSAKAYSYKPMFSPFVNICQYTPADFTISASLNHSWPVIHLVAFLISDRGYLTFFTDKTQLRGWKKRTNKQTQAWVSSNHKREVYDTFCAFCELKRACTQAKTLTKPLAMLTCLLALVNPASVGQ